MSQVAWSDWYPLDSQSANIPIPNSPGVYEIRTDFRLNRLRGQSPIVCIGSSVPSLRNRIINQRIGNPDRYLSRAEKFLRQAGHALQFRYGRTVDGNTARNLEAQMLQAYEEEHWELPPGNAELPRLKVSPDVT